MDYDLLSQTLRENDHYHNVAMVLKHPTRRKILRSLGSGEPQTLDQIADAVRVINSTIGRNLTYHIDRRFSFRDTEYGIVETGRSRERTARLVDNPLTSEIMSFLYMVDVDTERSRELEDLLDFFSGKEGVATHLLLRKNFPTDQKEIEERLEDYFGIPSVYIRNVPKILWKGRAVVRRMNGPG